MLTQDTPWIDKDFEINKTANGPLDGLDFAVKDIFNVKGHKNSLGVPDYKKYTHPASENAKVVNKLLQNGADLRGITITDELMYSITGSNSFYGAPLNHTYPDRYSGGSSSGSASAVANHLVDFALGSDTGGSTRVPATYCGIFGIRPSHEADLLTGVHVMAASFDTVGLLTRSSSLLNKVGQIIYNYGIQPLGPKIYIATELFDQLKLPVKEAMYGFLKEKIGNSAPQAPFEFIKKFPLASLSKTYQLIQGHEVWENYKDWIQRDHPTFGADVQQRITTASQIKTDSKEFQDALHLDQVWKKFIRSKLADAILILPTTPTPAPLKSSTPAQLQEVRTKTLQFTAPNSLSGLPQVSIPLQIDGLGYGISITGGYETDLGLLQFVSDKFKD